MPQLRTIPINASATACCWLCKEEEVVLLNSLQPEPGDEARYHAITHKNRKLQWLGCRLALASLLPPGPVSIQYDLYGKPSLSGREGHISFSHSGLYAVALYSLLHPAGIDIEFIRERIERIASRFLTSGEMTFLSPANRMEQLTICWSVKEAVYKIFGTPEIDLLTDIVIEPFEYLCSPSGSLTARVNFTGKDLRIPVSWYRIESAILTCAILEEDQSS